MLLNFTISAIAFSLAGAHSISKYEAIRAISRSRSARRSLKWPRVEYFYFSDDGDLTAFRYDNWKVVFMEQRVAGTMQIWAEPFVVLRIPKLFNLKTDPYERADITSNTYYDWFIDHVFLLVPAQKLVGEFLATFQAYPPRQKAASFTIDQVMEKLQSTGGAG